MAGCYLKALLLSSVFKYHGSMSDNNGMISDEAVEAAARALVEALKGDNAGYVDVSFRNDMTIDISGFDLPAAVRELLEAAAPYIAARGWEEGMEAMYGSTSHEWPPIPEANPYRSQA